MKQSPKGHATPRDGEAGRNFVPEVAARSIASILATYATRLIDHLVR